MSLIADLERLGDSLAAADLPADPRVIVGALVHYVETGSLEPVTYETPAETQATHEEQAEVARLRDQVEQLQAQVEAGQAAPAVPAAAVTEPQPGAEGATPPAAPVGAGVLPPPSAPPAEGEPEAQPPTAPAASA